MSDQSPKIAFYAPMKSPDSPVPSGDRTVARLYRAALSRSGYDVDVVSDFRSYDGKGDASFQAALEVRAAIERDRIAANWHAQDGRRPALWFTYHCYHKAPDLIGPELCKAYDIPYVIAEPSVAPKRASGAWQRFYALANGAIELADLVLLATERDGACVRPIRANRATELIPPFVDVEGWPQPEPRPLRDEIHLVTVAMMRHGDKLASYALLADALALCVATPFRLTIVGDGPARREVETLFEPFEGRIDFVGEIDRRTLGPLLGQHDVFVWPAVNEAYGMALLEAQAMGVPVIAGAAGGVPEVVDNDITGILVTPGDTAGIARAIERLHQDHAMQRRMADAAARSIRSARTVEIAARRIDALLRPLVRQP